jgi:hypothetical protein
MNAMPRRRRGSGSLGQLKARLWAVIEYAVTLVETETEDHETRLKGATVLVQGALAYGRIVELHVLEGEVEQLKQRIAGNGYA